MTITELEPAARAWNLSQDVADTIGAGNPHADQLGQRGRLQQFVKGSTLSKHPIARGRRVGSRLAAWRCGGLHARAARPRSSPSWPRAYHGRLLVGDRPGADRVPDQQLYDNLQSSRGPLLEGFDTSRLHGAKWRRPATAISRPSAEDHALAWRSRRLAAPGSCRQALPTKSAW